MSFTVSGEILLAGRPARFRLVGLPDRPHDSRTTAGKVIRKTTGLKVAMRHAYTIPGYGETEPILHITYREGVDLG